MEWTTTEAFRVDEDEDRKVFLNCAFLGVFHFPLFVNQKLDRD